jgi:hypothetical protein
MILIMEIAVGVFLGGCLLALVFYWIPKWKDLLADRRSDKEYQRYLDSRYRRAVQSGFKYDAESIYTPLEQLEKWEKAASP